MPWRFPGFIVCLELIACWSWTLNSILFLKKAVKKENRIYNHFNYPVFQVVELVHASASPFPCTLSQSTTDESVRTRDNDEYKECILEIMSRRWIGELEMENWVKEGRKNDGGLNPRSGCATVLNLSEKPRRVCV